MKKQIKETYKNVQPKGKGMVYKREIYRIARELIQEPPTFKREFEKEERK